MAAASISQLLAECYPPERRGFKPSFSDELMTFDEEKKFLEPWGQQAKDGGILVVSVIRAALAQH